MDEKLLDLGNEYMKNHGYKFEDQRGGEDNNKIPELPAGDVAVTPSSPPSLNTLYRFSRLDLSRLPNGR